MPVTYLYLKLIIFEKVIQDKLGSQSEGTEQVAEVRSPLEDLRGKHKNR